MSTIKELVKEIDPELIILEGAYWEDHDVHQNLRIALLQAAIRIGNVVESMGMPLQHIALENDIGITPAAPLDGKNTIKSLLEIDLTNSNCSMLASVIEEYTSAGIAREDVVVFSERHARNMANRLLRKWIKEGGQRVNTISDSVYCKIETDEIKVATVNENRLNVLCPILLSAHYLKVQQVIGRTGNVLFIDFLSDQELLVAEQANDIYQEYMSLPGHGSMHIYHACINTKGLIDIY